MKKTLKFFSLALLVSVATVQSEQVHIKTAVDKVGEALAGAAVAVADVVEEGTEKAKEVAASASKEVSLGLKKVRIKHEIDKAENAWRTEEEAGREVEELSERTKLAEKELAEMRKEIKHAEGALHQAEEAMYVSVPLVRAGQDEGVIDKVGVAALTVENAVVDTAFAVKNKLSAGVEAVKDFAVSTAAQARLTVERARSQHAQHKADEALNEKEKAERKLASIYAQIREAQGELATITKRTQLAHGALVQQHEAARIRSLVTNN